MLVAGGLNNLGWAAMTLAVNLAISGVTQLMTKGPEMDSAESNQGYLFNGPVNTVQEGLPVPIAYGELVVGGAVINQSFRSSPWPKPKISTWKNASYYAGSTGLATRNTTAYAGSYGSGELYTVIESEEEG